MFYKYKTNFDRIHFATRSKKKKKPCKCFKFTAVGKLCGSFQSLPLHRLPHGFPQGVIVGGPLHWAGRPPRGEREQQEMELREESPSVASTFFISRAWTSARQINFGRLINYRYLQEGQSESVVVVAIRPLPPPFPKNRRAIVSSRTAHKSRGFDF